MKGISVFAHHGVLPEEKEKGQEFLIDIEMEVDLGAAAESDRLDSTVDYSGVAEAAADIATGSRFDLIETLASRIAERLVTLDGVLGVTVTVRKPEAPLPVPAEWVGVSVRRTSEGVRGS